MKLQSFVLAATIVGSLRARWCLGSSLDDSTAYQEFLSKYSSEYDSSHCLSDEFCIHWKLTEGNEIELAVAVAGVSGWVGFGLSEAGSMAGSDIVVYEAKFDSLKDYYALDYARPVEDSCASDWEFLDATVSDEFLAFRAKRALDTGDPQDRALVDDSELTLFATSIIGSWGDEDAMTFHGPNNVARGSARFFAAVDDGETATETSSKTSVSGTTPKTAIEVLQGRSDGSFLVQEQDFPIPEVETTYYSACFNVSDVLTEVQMTTGVYLTGAEYIPSNMAGGMDTTPYVHHMVGTVRYTDCPPPGEEPRGGDLFFAWAGDKERQPTVFPENAGLKVGGADGVRSVAAQFHYDNVNEVTDLLDSSGIRWYYVSDPLEHEIGLLRFGDAVVSVAGSIVGLGGPAKHAYHCPGSCTESAFEETITVFAEQFHMHETGTRIVNNVMRDGNIIHTASVERFDFRSSGLVNMQQEAYKLSPGDSSVVTCFYDVPENTTTRFGYGTRDEMCQVGLYYFPAQKTSGAVCSPNLLPQCNGTHEVLTSDDSFERIFGTARSNCPAVALSADSDSAGTSLYQKVVQTLSWTIVLVGAML